MAGQKRARERKRIEMAESSSSSGSSVVVLADVRVGNNSVEATEDEYRVGLEGTGEPVVGQRTWDANLADGLNSGWVNVKLTAEGGANSEVEWEVNGGASGALSFEGASFQHVEGIRITAGVAETNCRMSWQNVVARYYLNGVLMQMVELGAGELPVASTMGSGMPPVSKSSEISPDGANNTKVVITGQVKLESTSTQLPGADAIVGSIALSVAN